MKRHPALSCSAHSSRLLLALSLATAIAPVHAATITKLDNTNNLNLATSWSGGVVPGANDIAFWDSTVTGPNTTLLGANLTLGGIRLTNPGGAVTISAGSTLTLLGGGIDMSAATQDLTINAGVALGSTTSGSFAQTWNVASGRTLTVAALPVRNAGTNNLSAGGVLNIAGDGTTRFSGSLSSALLTDGGGNPFVTYKSNDWAATDASGNVIAATYTNDVFTAGTNVNIVTANTYAINGATPASVRFANSGGAVIINNTGTSTLRGVLMTSDAQNVTINGGFLRPNRSSTVGATMSFIQNSTVGDLTIGSSIANGSSSTPVSITKSGAGKLILTGGNGYTGQTFIHEGTLQLGNGGTTGAIGSTAAIFNNGNFTVNRSDNVTVANVISGSGSVTQAGPGELTLSGVNTYTGATNLNGGALVLNAASNIGNGTALNFNGGALKYGTGSSVDVSSRTVTINSGGATVDTNGNNVTFANAIGNNGTGSLTKSGTGTLTLNGANTYSGGTVINGGTLAAGSANALGSGALTIGSGGSLSVGSFNLTVGAITLNGSSNLLLSGITSQITSSGAVNISGSDNFLNLGGSAVAAGSTYTLLVGNSLSASGLSLTGSGIGGATVALGGTTTLGRTTYAFNSTLTSLQLTVTGGAYNLTWNGGNAAWNTTDATWQKDGAGSNIAFFAGDNITIATGDSIAIDAGGITAGTLAVTNASGTAALTGGTLTTTSLSKSGAGTLQLGTTLSGASLSMSEGTLDLGTQNQSFSNVVLSGGEITGTTGVLTATGNPIDARAGTVGTTLAGSVGLTKSTAGTMILSGANTYTGATVINAGTLQIGNGGSTGSIANTSGVTNNATLAYNRGDALTAGYVISGTGALVKDGAGTLTLTNANTYSGATTINAGTLQIGSGGTTGSITGAGGVTNNASLAYNRSDNITVGYAISGTGSVVKDGAGTLTLSGANTYSGGTTLNSGTLVINSGGALGGGTLTALNGTTVSLTTSAGNGNAITLSGTNAVVALTSNQASVGYTGAFTGTSDQTLQINSGNVVNMNGTSRQFADFTGTVNILAGGSVADRSSSTVWVNGGDNTLFNVDGTMSSRNGGNWALGGLTGSGTLTMGNAGSVGIGLNYTIGARNDVQNTFSGVIQDNDTASGKTVSLTKVGTGILTLAGANTYTGTTTISGGTLALGSSGSLASTAIINNGTFDVSQVSGGYTVGSGQTLGGSGTVIGATLINGALNPGNSPGVLTFVNDLILAGTANFEINGVTRGTDYDAVNVGGTVTYGGVLNLVFGSTFLTGGEAFALFTDLLGTSAPLDAGSFTAIELQGAYTASLTNNSGVWTGSVDGLDFTFTQNDGILSVIGEGVIPEPSTYAVLAGAVMLAFAANRRRRRA